MFFAASIDILLLHSTDEEETCGVKIANLFLASGNYFPPLGNHKFAISLVPIP